MKPTKLSRGRFESPAAARSVSAAAPERPQATEPAEPASPPRGRRPSSPFIEQLLGVVQTHFRPCDSRSLERLFDWLASHVGGPLAAGESLTRDRFNLLEARVKLLEEALTRRRSVGDPLTRAENVE